MATKYLTLPRVITSLADSQLDQLISLNDNLGYLVLKSLLMEESDVVSKADLVEPEEILHKDYFNRGKRVGLQNGFKRAEELVQLAIKDKERRVKEREEKKRRDLIDKRMGKI